METSDLIKNPYPGMLVERIEDAITTTRASRKMVGTLRKGGIYTIESVGKSFTLNLSPTESVDVDSVVTVRLKEFRMFREDDGMEIFMDLRKFAPAKPKQIRENDKT